MQRNFDMIWWAILSYEVIKNAPYIFMAMTGLAV